MLICNFGTLKNSDKDLISPRFASPSTGFSRILTTHILSQKRFSTHWIYLLRLLGLTWTFIFIQPIASREPSQIHWHTRGCPFH